MFTVQLDWDRPAKLSHQTTAHVLRVRLTPRTDTPSLPLHLAIALDTSASMSGAKLRQAKIACEAVVAQLRDRDRLALASFATQVTPLIDQLSGNAIAVAHDAIQRLQASGTTRADLALDWLERALPATDGVTRVAILITDGHPTNPQGRMLDDTTALIQQADRLTQAGIMLCTVGLGDAANFNTEFLLNLSDRGRGEFLYADTPASLHPLLQAQLHRAQAVAANGVQLHLAPAPGVALHGFCRYRPDYLPLEEVAPNTVALPALAAAAPTDVLVQVQVPPLQQATTDVLQVTLTGVPEPPAAAMATLRGTQSYREAQQIQQDVDNDRLGWEINLNSTELTCTHDPNRTGELLTNIQVAALKSGRVSLAQQAAHQLDDLQQSGQLSPHKTTGLLRETRQLGGDGQ